MLIIKNAQALQNTLNQCKQILVVTVTGHFDEKMLGKRTK